MALLRQTAHTWPCCFHCLGVPTHLDPLSHPFCSCRTNFPLLAPFPMPHSPASYSLASCFDCLQDPATAVFLTYWQPECQVVEYLKYHWVLCTNCCFHLVTSFNPLCLDVADTYTCIPARWVVGMHIYFGDSTYWINYGTFLMGNVLHEWWPKSEETIYTNLWLLRMEANTSHQKHVCLQQLVHK